MLNPAPATEEANLYRYWSNRWQKVREEILATCPGFFDDPAYWDGTLSQVKEEDLQRIPSDIADFILQIGLVDGNSRVLDIGCGVGNYAIPLARAAQRVTALDPSQKLLDLLAKKAEGDGLINIELLRSFWNREVALPMRKQYDFVMASFCPGVTDADGLIRLHNSSARNCAIIGYHSSADPELDRLYREITGKGSEPNIFEIVYPFNLLYGLGIAANLKLFTWRNRQRFSSGHAYASCERLFERLTPLDDRKRAAILRYVDENSREGYFCREGEVHVGLLWWESGTLLQERPE